MYLNNVHVGRTIVGIEGEVWSKKLFLSDTSHASTNTPLHMYKKETLKFTYSGKNNSASRCAKMFPPAPQSTWSRAPHLAALATPRIIRAILPTCRTTYDRSAEFGPSFQFGKNRIHLRGFKTGRKESFIQ